MATKVTVSSRNQIVVPAEVRKKLGIKSGDRLLMGVRGNLIYLIPEPKNYSERLRGLHAEIWEGIDPNEYLRQERGAWES